MWSVESLPSKPAARVRFPAGSGILIYVLGLGMCPLCSVCVEVVSDVSAILLWLSSELKCDSGAARPAYIRVKISVCVCIFPVYGVSQAAILLPPFSLATNFIPPFLHTHFILYVSVMVHQAWSTSFLAIYRPSIKGLHRISSLDSTNVGHELRRFIYYNPTI